MHSHADVNSQMCLTGTGQWFEEGLIMSIKKLGWDLIRSEAGQDLVEYAVLTSLISLASVVTVGVLGTSIGVVFQTVANQLEQ